MSTNFTLSNNKMKLFEYLLTDFAAIFEVFKITKIRNFI